MTKIIIAEKNQKFFFESFVTMIENTINLKSTTIFQNLSIASSQKREKNLLTLMFQQTAQKKSFKKNLLSKNNDELRITSSQITIKKKF